MKKYHYIYKITCLCGSLAGKYYYGKHSTKDKEDPFHDNYYGSGSVLIKYYKKYKPIEGETILKEIIEFNPSKEINAIRERKWIGDKWETDPMCLNLKPGGDGGVVMTDEIRKKISDRLKGHTPWNKGVPMTDAQKEKYSLAHMGQKAWNKGMKGVMKTGPCSDERKRRISEAKKGICTDRMKLAAEKSKVPIIEIRSDGTIVRWDSATDAEHDTGINHSLIAKVCNGKRNQTGGSKWQYADEYYKGKRTVV